MKEKTKTIIAFIILALLIIAGFVLNALVTGSLDDEIKPYRFGFCISGLVFLLMLFIPNIIWAKREKAEGYEEAAKRENKVLLAFERTGEVMVTATLIMFKDFDPCIRQLPEGVVFSMRLIFWVLAFALMILYECYWIRYFRSPGTMKDFYSSFAGFPVAGASLPVIAVLLLGIYSHNLILLAAGVILGIGHIGIHLMHKKEVTEE